MRQLLIICLSALVLFGCGKEEDNAPAPLMSAYASKYMVHNTYGISYLVPNVYGGGYYNIIDYLNSTGCFLEYKEGKLQTRRRVQECVLNNSCLVEPTRQVIIDDVTYGDNSIKITNRSGTSEQNVLKQQWLFKLKNSQQPLYLLHKAENRVMYDSLSYAYDSNGKIMQIMVYSVYKDEFEKVVNEETKKDFYFNASGNLERVESWHLLGDGTALRKTTETFGDYDTAVNPFKNLFMFEDTYYRSLSENNFRKYRMHEVELPTGTVRHEQGKDWNLQYDKNNWPQFDVL